MRKEHNALRSYLEISRKYPPLSKEKEKDILTRAQEGCRDARDLLIKSNLRFIIKLAREYAYRGIPIEVLINEGVLALHEALKRFDPEKGKRFIVYAAWWIRNHMRSVIAEQSLSYTIPVKKMDAESKLRTTWAAFEQRHGRRPRIFEIAEELGVKEAELVAVIKLYSNFSVHLQDKESLSNRFQISIDECKNTKEGDAEVSHRVCLEINAILETIDSRDAEILRMYFGISVDRKYTLEEIGTQYNISRERVRQLKERALEKLRHHSLYSTLEVFREGRLITG